MYFDQNFEFRDGKPVNVRLAEMWDSQPRIHVDDDQDAQMRSRMNAVVWMLACLAFEVLGGIVAAAYYFVVRYGGKP